MSRVVVFDETGAPEVLHIVDEPVGNPGAGEVRIRIEAVGINRLDQMMRAGMSPRPIRLPHARLGVEATGTIDALGAGVEGWAIGDAVIVTAVPDMDCNGTYAEHIALPADRVVARPAGLEATSAAALWVAYSTAYGALVEKAAMQPGHHVLITAASSAVGLAAIQIANQIGAIPLAVTRHAAKKDTLLAAGAAAVIVTDHDDVVEATHRHTNGAGADIVLDSSWVPAWPIWPTRPNDSVARWSPWAGWIPDPHRFRPARSR
jgi:NADPH:quinone reductase-like Zn-dependent oxidoreductase